MLTQVFFEKIYNQSIICMKKNIIVLDDTCKSNSGGTSLTLNALSNNIQELNFIFIETNELNKDSFDKIPNDCLWVIGNILNISNNNIGQIFNILMFRDFVKIEFDYGFCRYRCEYGFKKFTGNDKWEPFDKNGSLFLKNIYTLIHTFAKKIFYMSKSQMDLHKKILDFEFLDDSKMEVLGSCFSTNDLMNMINFSLSRKSKKNDILNKYAIVDGNGGWHSEAKGIKKAIQYAKENKIDFDIIKNKNYENFITELSKYKGLIFLPIIHDTCPRLTIEAKLIGLELILNDNCQHVKEDWFSLKEEDLANYLLERPLFFYNSIKEFL
jgi:hypothetical protein